MRYAQRTEGSSQHGSKQEKGDHQVSADCIVFFNLQYIRFRNFFVILASEGEHVFKQREASRLQDVRRKGIQFGGYLISFRNGHVQVRIDDETYRQLKAHYVGLALRRTKYTLISEFYAAPFEPYSPVKRQMFNILREVN